MMKCVLLEGMYEQKQLRLQKLIHKPDVPNMNVTCKQDELYACNQHDECRSSRTQPHAGVAELGHNLQDMSCLEY